jgi:hypothetical protein
MSQPTSFGRHYKFYRPTVGVEIVAGHNAQIGLRLDPFSASQTGPLLRARDFAGTSILDIYGNKLLLTDTAQTTAAGVSKVDVTVSSLTNALTGSQIAFNGRSNNKVASMTGACEGAHLLAANYEDSASGTLRGAYIGILTKAKDIAVARGLEVIVDTDDTEVIGTELAGAYIVVQTDSSMTFSGIATGLHIRHSGVSGGGGKLLNSMIMLDSESNQIGANVIIDASGLKERARTGNIVCLMSFKGSDGVVNYLLHDNDSPTAVYCSTTLPS